MRLVHTLLFMLSENRMAEDTEMAEKCLKSLEKSSYKEVVVYNQGALTNEQLKEFLGEFSLDFHVIGEGANVGTAAGRQKCFEYIWNELTDVDYISELHIDMIFTDNWENALVEYLDISDEPLISCGIIDKNGNMPFSDRAAAVLPDDYEKYGDFLKSLRTDKVEHGFTNPCVHVSKILKETGGYDKNFLKGGQCFEDDSMLLGYYYYYGTRRNWYPKINYNSVVYHSIAGQRFNVYGNITVNLNGLIKQYGAMGLKSLSTLHKSEWHKSFFTQYYNDIIK